MVTEPADQLRSLLTQGGLCIRIAGVLLSCTLVWTGSDAGNISGPFGTPGVVEKPVNARGAPGKGTAIAPDNGRTGTGKHSPEVVRLAALNALGW